jgi:hypothetical protein
LLHGLSALRELDGDGRVPAYLSAISDENATARGILVEHPRPGFPRFHEVAHIHTLGIVLRKPRISLATRRGRHRSLDIGRGSISQLGEVVAFLRQHGARRQFFPAYEEADFRGPTTRGFRMDDLVVARRRDQILGVLGLWDQSSYKQTVVQCYAQSLQRLRPLYNLLACLAGIQPLPSAGQHIRSAYASFVCVADDDPGVFAALLREVTRLAAARGYAYLMIGLAERDPLLPTARGYPHIAYHSTLYVASWENDRSLYAWLDDRVPYIEIAAL